jgi:hypothetical protein
MEQEKKVVLDFTLEEDGKKVHKGWLVYCPGCKSGHLFDDRWTFNGDMMKPTFMNSMLVNQSDEKTRCHSFVKDGMIQFLGDCGHELRNQTVPLEAIY